MVTDNYASSKQASSESDSGRRGSEKIVVGRLGAAHGVKGWIKIASYTERPEDIFNYSPWRLTLQSPVRDDGRDLQVKPEQWRQQGKGLVVRLADIDDRTAAESLRGAEIAVDAACLPKLEQGQYYWRDLIGLKVQAEGELIGTVVRLLETGANDVLVIRLQSPRADGNREVLVPCTNDVVLDVSTEKGEMTIDWDLSPDD